MLSRTVNGGNQTVLMDGVLEERIRRGTVKSQSDAEGYLRETEP